MRHDHDALTALLHPRADETKLARRARRLNAFVPVYRQRIHELMAADERLEDLADSFPGLLFAYATGFGDGDARARSIRLVLTGAPLRAAAEAIGLPQWLRRLPASAYAVPLRPMPLNEDFACRMHGLVPGSQLTGGAWLARVLLANEVCGEDAAVWIARQYRGAGPQADDLCHLHVLAWIWHAGRPQALPHRLLRLRWHAQIAVRRAEEEIELWRQRLALAVALGEGVKDTWLAEGHSRGYDFVALKSAEDFIAEAERMDNCLDQYAHRLEGRAVRVFSVRKDGRSVANLEIACHEQELGIPAIAQLRAIRNRRAATDVWQAAYAWLGSQQIRQADPELLRQDKASRRRTTAKLWRPFLESLSGETRGLFAAAFGTRATLPRRVRASGGAQVMPGSTRPCRSKAAG